MARWLVEFPAVRSAAAAASSCTHHSCVAAILSVFLLSLCCIALILSVCSFCGHQQARVGDKLAGSFSSDGYGDGDGDGDGVACPARSGKPSFFILTLRKASPATPALSSQEEKEGAAEEQHQGKRSPHVWQRAILMGERCQRPNFSGLILYDEKGNPLPRKLTSSCLQAPP